MHLENYLTNFFTSIMAAIYETPDSSWSICPNRRTESNIRVLL